MTFRGNLQGLQCSKIIWKSQKLHSSYLINNIPKLCTRGYCYNLLMTEVRVPAIGGTETLLVSGADGAILLPVVVGTKSLSY